MPVTAEVSFIFSPVVMKPDSKVNSILKLDSILCTSWYDKTRRRTAYTRPLPSCSASDIPLESHYISQWADILIPLAKDPSLLPAGLLLSAVRVLYVGLRDMTFPCMFRKTIWMLACYPLLTGWLSAVPCPGGVQYSGSWKLTLSDPMCFLPRAPRRTFKGSGETCQGLRIL